MKRLVSAAALAIALLPAAALAQVTALVGGTVVDLSGKSPITDAVVLVEGERILSVGPAASTPVPAGATVVPMAGKWLIPGMMNMHVHLGLNLPGAAHAYNEKPEATAMRMLENAQKSLMAGTTTVRLTGERDHIEFAVKQAIDSGAFAGPRIYSAGEIIAITGGHGYREADGPDEWAEAVRDQIKAGATWIKIAVSGGIADTHGDINAAPMTDDEMRTTIEVAHRNGVKVTAHNGSSGAALQALKFGIDGFEHGYHLDDEVLKQMQAKGTWLVPTIVVSQPGARAFYQKIGSPDWYLDRVDSTGKDHWAMLQKAIRLHINIAMGSDQFPWEPNQGTSASVRETELYAEAGMTPLQALRAATVEPARMLGVDKQVGELKPGYLADILAIDADPLKDIHALRTIGFVMKGGAIVRDDADPARIARRH